MKIIKKNNIIVRLILIFIVFILIFFFFEGCSKKSEKKVIFDDKKSDSEFINISKKNVLTLSITTSVYATGLADAIAEYFKKHFDIELRFIPKGTGGAILDAKSGASDAIIVHAVNSEKKFLEQGYGVNRKVFAYNFFIIVGPEDDPAGINGLSPVNALKQIVKAARKGNAIWITRDDNSGTNKKEIALWKMAGFDIKELKKEGWIRSTGEGMGKTLLYANQVKAYTLSDTGTYLKYFKDNLIKLKKLVFKGEELTNVYSIITVNPDKIRGKNFNLSLKLTEWLISKEGQKFIEYFGKNIYGDSLFFPAVKILENNKMPYTKWIVKYGFILKNGFYYECPDEYVLKAGFNFFKFKKNQF